jgi:uncharacterized protein (DUF885 family)
VNRGLRLVSIAFVGLAVALVVFAVPTIWFKPWFIEHFYARVFIEFALDRPMLLSQLRILEPYGLEFHSDDLDDFSVEFTRETAQKVERNLRILRSYDRDIQSEEQVFSTSILDWFLSIQREGEPFLFHDYPLNQLSGVQSLVPDFMLTTHQVRNLRDARNYGARLSRIGVALDQTIEGVRFRAERGVVPPRFVVRRVQREVESFLARSPTENVLYSEFRKKLEGIGDLGDTQRDELLEAAGLQIRTVVYPAYGRLAGYLSELEKLATEEDGVWKLPEGDAYYAWALRSHTTTEMTADEIHRVGLAEVARLHSQMRRILQAEGYATEDLGGTLHAIHRERRFLYPETDAGRARILEDYQRILDEVIPRLPRYFGRIPAAPVSVERVPAFKEAGAPGAYYRPPALDGSRPGIFFANLRNVEEVPRFGMRTLAFHEAIPGHHLQIALALELEGIPFFRRVIPFTAFTEGWALYAERLAAEEGFHPTPYDHLGQLVAEVFRAVRLVVDTGIHAKRWTRNVAIDYMVRNTGMPETDVVAEVERYIVNPGQACAYKVGQLKILELRDRARAVLGERFDYREFHDVVLGNGALPLTILEQQVERWLQQKSRG